MVTLLSVKCANPELDCRWLVFAFARGTESGKLRLSAPLPPSKEHSVIAFGIAFGAWSHVDVGGPGVEAGTNEPAGVEPGVGNNRWLRSALR